MDAVESLLEERRGYVARGLFDRVAQVDAALASFGHKPPHVETTAMAPAVETTAVPRGRARKP